MCVCMCVALRIHRSAMDGKMYALCRKNVFASYDERRTMERAFHMLATFSIKKWMNYSLIWFVCGAFACVTASPLPFRSLFSEPFSRTFSFARCVPISSFSICMKHFTSKRECCFYLLLRCLHAKLTKNHCIESCFVDSYCVFSRSFILAILFALFFRHWSFVFPLWNFDVFSSSSYHTRTQIHILALNAIEKSQRICFGVKSLQVKV